MIERLHNQQMECEHNILTQTEKRLSQDEILQLPDCVEISNEFG